MPVVDIPLEFSTTDFHKGDTAAVVGVHVGMYLKHKACKIFFLRTYPSFLRLYG